MVNRFAPLTRVTSGAVPPPENRTSTVDATGRTDPSALVRNVVSTAAQLPSARCTRLGAAETSSVELPSGLAYTCADSVRADRSSTRRAQDFATLRACCSVAALSTQDTPAGGLAAAVAAPTATATADGASRARPAAGAMTQRRVNPEESHEGTNDRMDIPPSPVDRSR